jgi:hypothetical protein
MMRSSKKLGTLLSMASSRPRVALRVTPRLFRDALTRVLDPHVDVVVVPDDSEFAEWVKDQLPFDLAIVSGTAVLVDLDAQLVVEIPLAQGATTSVGTVQHDGRTIRTLGELLELLPASA